jgi:polysaccharide export outer membrane protein
MGKLELSRGSRIAPFLCYSQTYASGGRLRAFIGGPLVASVISALVFLSPATMGGEASASEKPVAMLNFEAWTSLDVNRESDITVQSTDQGNKVSPSGKSDSAQTKTQQDKNDPLVYRIGIEDELQISVWKEPELSITAVVRPDGMITMPLLNDIYVVGFQPVELQALLAEKLKPFVNEPQVTVVIRGIKSRKVFVYGQVLKAGAYPLVTKKTVLEILTEAGGLAPFAKKRSIYILREVNGKKTQIPFNYNDALKGKSPQSNVELLPGDIVVVP